MVRRGRQPFYMRLCNGVHDETVLKIFINFLAKPQVKRSTVRKIVNVRAYRCLFYPLQARSL